MKHFWGSSGHLLLDRADGGGLLLTDDYLKAYLARPELQPPPDACAEEKALAARLMVEPRGPVSPADIGRLADADARENWGYLLALRDRLLAAPTLERAYATLVADGGGGLPPLFLQQLAHVILRNVLDDCEDAFAVRAAELFYRTQRATHHEGTILLADAEIIDKHEHDRHSSPLLAMLGGPAVSELDVLTPDNAEGYWGRSDAFDMVLDLGGQPSGRAALAEVMRLWVRHFTGHDAAITPVERIEDADWRWFIGLDSEATRLGNAMWRGEALPDGAAERILALFRMDLPADAPVLPQVAGHPVWLIMAMDAERTLRLKPQNLLAGLPLQPVVPT
jgi:hypothetical protein